MNQPEVAYFKCSCTMEVVALEKDSEDNFLCVSIYELPKKVSIWWKLRAAFLLVTTGKYYGDQVMLSLEESKRMSEWLVETYKV